jgi:hypothetical protein
MCPSNSCIFSAAITIVTRNRVGTYHSSKEMHCSSQRKSWPPLKLRAWEWRGLEKLMGTWAVDFASAWCSNCLVVLWVACELIGRRGVERRWLNCLRPECFVGYILSWLGQHMAQFGIHFVLPFITSGLVLGSLYDSLYPIDLDYLGSCSTFQFKVPKSTAPFHLQSWTKNAGGGN